MRISLIGLDASATDREVTTTLVDRYNQTAAKGASHLQRTLKKLREEADEYSALIAEALVTADDTESAVSARTTEVDEQRAAELHATAAVTLASKRLADLKRALDNIVGTHHAAQTRLTRAQRTQRQALNVLRQHRAAQTKAKQRITQATARSKKGLPYPENDKNIGYFLSLVDRRHGLVIFDSPTFLEVSFKTKRITQLWAETRRNGTWPINTFFPKLLVRIRLNQGEVSRSTAVFLAPIIEDPVDILAPSMDYVMPHISRSGALCCGSQGSADLLDHMSAGRWLDAAILTCHLLSHYNAGDPYQVLSAWVSCHTDNGECPCGYGTPHAAEACSTPRCFVCSAHLPPPKAGQAAAVAHANCLQTEAKRQGNPFPGAKGICGLPIFPDLLGSPDRNQLLTHMMGSLLERLEERYERNQSRICGGTEDGIEAAALHEAGHGPDVSAGEGSEGRV